MLGLDHVRDSLVPEVIIAFIFRTEVLIKIMSLPSKVYLPRTVILDMMVYVPVEAIGECKVLRKNCFTRDAIEKHYTSHNPKV